MDGFRQSSDFQARFFLGEKLGNGCFGAVHKVTERGTGQLYAAKMLKCMNANDKIKIQRENSIMRALCHPKLLKLAAVFESERDIVRVME